MFDLDIHCEHFSIFTKNLLDTLISALITIFTKQEFPLGVPTQVDFTCAQLENSCAQFRAIARNGIAIGNSSSHLSWFSIVNIIIYVSVLRWKGRLGSVFSSINSKSFMCSQCWSRGKNYRFFVHFASISRSTWLFSSKDETLMTIINTFNMTRKMYNLCLENSL